MTTTRTKLNKPTYKTEKVLLDTGEVIYIKRCALANMETLLEIQERLLNYLVDCDGDIGLLFTREEVLTDLKTICNLLPIVSSKEEYLNFEDIQENWEQIIQLFFTDGLNEETRVISDITPSKVSKLHFLPYMKT